MKKTNLKFICFIFIFLSLFSLCGCTNQKTKKIIIDIDSLSDPISLNNENEIIHIRNEYESLSKDEKEKVNNYSKLIEAENKIKEIKAKLDNAHKEALIIVDRIASLKSVSLESKDEIVELRKIYNDFIYKEMISNYEDLLFAEEKLNLLENEYRDKLSKIIIFGDKVIDDYGLVESFNGLGEEIDVFWESSDENIAIVDSDGIVYKKTFGVINIIATSKTNPANKSYFEVDIRPTKGEILIACQEIENYIRYITPSETTEDIVFIDNYEKYKAVINYVSFNEEYLTNDGKINRSLENKFVTVQTTILVYGEEYSFNLLVKIDQISLDEQYDNVKKWLDSKTRIIIENEEGNLPLYEEVYGNKITWTTNYPYLIDAKNGLHPSYIETNILLSANVKIGGEMNIISYEYKSKGIDEMDKENYINKILENILPNEAGKIINLAYTGPINIIQDFIYPDETNQIRPSSNTDPHEGLKMPGGVQWIVIHDTGMTHPNDNAARLNRYIHAQASNDYSELYEDESMRVASWHFSIDDKEIYQHVPTDEVAWHAGDGSTVYPNTWINNKGTVCLGGGNRNGIGIETCINPENDYILTLKRTAKLVASLLNQYNLGIERIKQHYDFSEKNCPNVIRSYGYWDEFIKETEFQLWILKTGISLEFSWLIDKPEIIDFSGRVKPSIKDEEVTITLNAKINGIDKQFHYKILVKGKKI